jgi:hypothetical protein
MEGLNIPYRTRKPIQKNQTEHIESHYYYQPIENITGQINEVDTTIGMDLKSSDTNSMNRFTERKRVVSHLYQSISNDEDQRLPNKGQRSSLSKRNKGAENENRRIRNRKFSTGKTVM